MYCTVNITNIMYNHCSLSFTKYINNNENLKIHQTSALHAFNLSFLLPVSKTSPFIYCISTSISSPAHSRGQTTYMPPSFTPF